MSETFATFLASKMLQRNFDSDEKLAKVAIAKQSATARRINIHARTISNWRRGKAQPRSADDPKLKLILVALNASNEDLDQVAKFLGKQERPIEKTEHARTIAKTENPIGKSPVASGQLAHHGRLKAAAFLAAALMLAGLLFFGSSPDKEIANNFVEDIPPLQLRLSVDGYVLPRSNVDLISLDTLDGLTNWELYVARNEIFARKGRRFIRSYSECLQKHFNSWAIELPGDGGWYRGRSGEPRISTIEEANVRIIEKYECGVRGGQMRCDGLLHIC